MVLCTPFKAFVCFVLSCASFTLAVSPKDSFPSLARHLQETKTEYFNSYVARIKFLLDGECSAPKPALRITCQNGGTLAILSASHSSIFCSVSLARPDYEGSERVCVSSCDSFAACEEVFVTSDAEDDTYGEIYFECSGDYERATFAVVSTLESPESTEVSCRSSLGGNSAFYVLQLGIFCSYGGSTGSFTFRSQFLECVRGTLLDEGIVVGSHYACASGYNCGSSACTYDTISPVAIETELEDFGPFCIQESVVPGIAQSAPPAPAPITIRGDIAVQYQARWGLDLDSLWCNYNLPVVDLYCNEGGRISLVNTLYDSVQCTRQDANHFRCQETCSSCRHFLFDRDNFPEQQRYSGAVFECSGFNIDQVRASVQVNSNSGRCEAPPTSLWFGQRVQLAPLCGPAEAGGDYIFWDVFAECDLTNWHEMENGADGDGFGCQEWFRQQDSWSTPWSVDSVTVFVPPVTALMAASMIVLQCFTELDLEPATTPRPTPGSTDTVAEPPTFAPTPGPTSITATLEPSTVPPTRRPAAFPTTVQPSVSPTSNPTVLPTTVQPSVSPTRRPTLHPTVLKSSGPSIAPSVGPPEDFSIEPSSIVMTAAPSPGSTNAPTVADPSDEEDTDVGPAGNDNDVTLSPSSLISGAMKRGTHFSLVVMSWGAMTVAWFWM